MQKVPSSSSQIKTDEIKTTSKTSATTKQGDTKKPAENTDHTTVSTSFCGCKKDKCDAFFDKLLNYLEKQSDLIAKCCAHSREHKRRSLDQITFTSSQEVKPRNPSPCKDEPKDSRQPSVETQKSLREKAKAKDPESESTSGQNRKAKQDYSDEGLDTKPSRYKSTLDVGNKPMKIGDKPCNIYVEVCSCKKPGRPSGISKASSPSKKIPSKIDEDRASQKTRLETPPRQYSSTKHDDCRDYEQKVSTFMKLADEICEGYMKQCQELGDRKSPLVNSRRPSKEESYLQAASKPDKSRSWNEDYRPDSESCARPIAIEIECDGVKEEFTVDPCCCPRDGDRRRPGDCKRTCLEDFEDRYGKTLRELQAKLLEPVPSKEKGDSEKVKPPPKTPPKKEAKSKPEPPSSDDDDSSEERKKKKKENKKDKKDKKKKKKKSSQDS